MVSKSLSELFGKSEEAAEVSEGEEGSKVGLNWSPPTEEAAPVSKTTKAAAKPKKGKKMAKRTSEQVKANPKRGLESTHWHDDPASWSQTMKIFKLTKVDVRPLELTKKLASDMIDQALKDADGLRADLLGVDGVIDRKTAEAKPEAKPAKAAPAPKPEKKQPEAKTPKPAKVSEEDAEEIARLRKQIAGYKAANTRRKKAEAA